MDEAEATRIHQEILDLAKSNKHRIDEIEEEMKEQRELITAVNNLATEQKYIKTALDEMKTDVKEIKEKPGRRWDGALDKIVMIILAAVVTYMLAQVGL